MIVYISLLIHINTFIIMRQLFFLYYLIFSINVLCCIHHFMFHIPNFRFISASTSSAGLNIFHAFLYFCIELLLCQRSICNRLLISWKFHLKRNSSLEYNLSQKHSCCIRHWNTKSIKHLLCLLITQILSAQFSKLLRYFLHTCDWFIIFIHDAFLQN